jgi:isoleucyl-tRNA synthetase
MRGVYKLIHECDFAMSIPCFNKNGRIRRVVTGALEIERAAKNIGSSLEAAPELYINDAETWQAVQGIDLAELCITSDLSLINGEGPEGAFRLEDVKHVSVIFKKTSGTKCARSWKISPLVGTDKDYPDVTPRDAAALREWDGV